MKDPTPATVVISARLGALSDQERRLEEHGAIVRSAPLWTRSEAQANAADADIIILGAVEPFDSLMLESLPRTRAVVRRGVGVDNVDLKAATELGIVVANVPDASVEEVSDHALALLLSLERRIGALDTVVRNAPPGEQGAQLQAARGRIRRFVDLTLGIVGFGRIGQALARKTTPIYGRVVAADPYASAAVAAELGVELVSADIALAEADHLSLHLPMGPDTRHFIGAAQLASMRPEVIIVNTARGGIIDEAALLAAIGEGHVGGAGLDVTEREPLGPGDPLLTAGQVVLTGHSAMASVASTQALAARSVDAAIDLLAGRLPASIVNTDVLRSPNLRIPTLRNVLAER